MILQNSNELAEAAHNPMSGYRKSHARVSVAIAPRWAELRRLLRRVDEFASAHQLPAQAWYCTRLALEEIVTNVLKYARPQGPGHAIIVQLALNEHAVTLRIEDEGAPFNPLLHVHDRRGAQAQDKAKGGQGLLLVKNLMDTFTYRRYRQKNIVTLQKNLDRN